MKKILMVLVAMALLVTACQKNKYSGSCKLNNNVDSISYALGFVQGAQFRDLASRSQFDTIDVKYLAAAFSKSGLNEEFKTWAKGMFDTISTEPYMFGFCHQVLKGQGYISNEMADIMLQNKVSEIRTVKDSLRAQQARENIEKGKAFLAENATKEGVVTLESGIQYKIITEAKGEKPTATDRVKVHYTGSLLDGTVFDSSVERGTPATFAVNGVISGWTEILQLMPVGSKWTVYIPSELAYGERGAGENIPGNSTLIFDIELLEIVK